MARRLLWAAAVLSCTALAFVGILNFLENAVLYHPHPYRKNYERLVSSGVVELSFQTQTGRQTAFYVPPRHGSHSPDRIWVVFCGNGSLALDWLPLTSRSQTANTAFLLVDYPGYGKSEGRPGIANTRAAADGALGALAVRLGVQVKTLEPRLNTLGHSLGAAAALDFAIQHPQLRRIILVAPFTSVREEAALLIGRPLSNLLRTSYDNRAALAQLALRRPPPQVVIFHGLEDGMIPPQMSHDLMTEFPALVRFHPIAGANHDSVVVEAEDQILGLMADDTKN